MDVESPGKPGLFAFENGLPAFGAGLLRPEAPMTSWEFLNQKFEPNERDPLNLSQRVIDSMRNAAIQHALQEGWIRNEERWMKAAEAAEYLGVHYQTFLDWTNDEEENVPKIPLRGGNDFRYTRRMLDEWGRQRAENALQCGRKPCPTKSRQKSPPTKSP
jgi:hypothetical protein